MVDKSVSGLSTYGAEVWIPLSICRSRPTVEPVLDPVRLGPRSNLVPDRSGNIPRDDGILKTRENTKMWLGCILASRTKT